MGHNRVAAPQGDQRTARATAGPSRAAGYWAGRGTRAPRRVRRLRGQRGRPRRAACGCNPHSPAANINFGTQAAVSAALRAQSSTSCIHVQPARAANWLPQPLKLQVGAAAEGAMRGRTQTAPARRSAQSAGSGAQRLPVGERRTPVPGRARQTGQRRGPAFLFASARTTNNVCARKS